MDAIQLIGYSAGILTTIAVLPQIIKSWKTREINDVSPFMFSLLVFGVGLWTVYGILKNDVPIIIFNGISFILNSSMLLLLFLYRKK